MLVLEELFPLFLGIVANQLTVICLESSIRCGVRLWAKLELERLSRELPKGLILQGELLVNIS